MSIGSINTVKLPESAQLQREESTKFDRDELEKEVLEIFDEPSNVDIRELVYRATQSVLPNPFEAFDYEKFKKRLNCFDQKQIKSKPST